MFDATWTDELTAHTETAVAHEAFERAAEDVEADLDAWGRGEWRHPRLGEVEHCDGFDRYTVTVDDAAYGDVMEAVRKLNSMVKRWGGEVRVTGEEIIQVPHPLVKRRMVQRTVLTIEAPAVAGERAKLIGSFEAAEDGVSIYKKPVPGYTSDDLEPFLHRWQDCDHCGYNRQRLSSFVCEKEDGTRVIIGRNCSMAYLGLSPADLLARAAIAKALTSEAGDEDSIFGGGSRGTWVEGLVQKAYRVAQRFGGYSRSIRDQFYTHVAALEGAKDFGKSTTFADIRREYAERKAKGVEKEIDLVALVDYVYGLDGDYGDNVRIAMGCEFVKDKRRAWIISAVGLFFGKVERQSKAAEFRASLPAPKHAPFAEGERFEAEGVVVRTHAISSDFGTTLIISIRCDDGSNLVHFNTGAGEKPAKGDRVKVRGTVKAHKINERYNNEPETVITRAKYEVIAKGA